MVLLLHHGTCFNLRSTTEPLVWSASFSSFFVAMVCGGDSWLRLRLWFMLRASSYTFFSSIRDSWFVLKVVEPPCNDALLHGEN